jgi:hypothetical protein
VLCWQPLTLALSGVAARAVAAGWECDGFRGPPPRVQWRDGNGPYQEQAAEGYEGCMTQMM